MTEILLMSDSHGDDRVVQAIMKAHPFADLKIHCGDLCSYPEKFPDLLIVQGNNDYFDVPKERTIRVEGIRIYITHSHRLYSWSRETGLAALAAKNQASLVFYGHTHTYDDSVYQGIRLVNPGSCWHNRSSEGPTYAYVTVDGTKVTVTKHYVKDLPEYKNSTL